MPTRESWTQDGVFEPAELKLMGEAYEQVLAILAADPGLYAPVPPDQRRAVIADAILIAAQSGIREPERFEQAALKALAELAAQQNASADHG